MSNEQKNYGSLALSGNRVITINATQQPENIKLRVAAYVRVSSDSMDQLNSFMAQSNYYTTLISSKENWKLVDTYADEGITGTSAEKRPDFQRLLSDCRKGLIDKVLVKSISRFARNTKDCLETIRELKSIGVAVSFEEQNIDTSEMTGELLTSVFAAIAQKESESISGNMRWSLERRMQSGTFLPSCPPFGYRLINNEIEVDEDAAAVVKQIYRDYLNGINMDEIALRLNRENILVRLGKEERKWRHGAISYILSNEKYTGDSLWQKTYASDTFPVQKFKNHGERKMYYAEGTHPPLIDKDTFQAVQALKAERRKSYRKVPKSELHTFHKRLVCGFCGAYFRRAKSNGKAYWICRGRYEDATLCSQPRIPETEIYNAFLRLFYKLKHHGSPILEQMITDYQSIRERKLLWSTDIIELNKRIFDISDQNRMLAEMNQLGLVDSDFFIAKSNELAQQLQAAKQKKERIINSSCDNTISQTQEILDLLEFMPDYLHTFNAEVFDDLIDHMTSGENDSIHFHLKNGLEIVQPLKG